MTAQHPLSSPPSLPPPLSPRGRAIAAADDIGPARAASASSGGGGGGGGVSGENECMICLCNFEPGQAIRVC